ncbi:hypothetical protein Zmor_026919 [Zophobas morio]|uniref:Peptidase S1 domain-containing protein n=1 Tax=Zophobas morio TaxID=2755281 RepID=A0AA38HVN8_9CUCU|nr:hypothetical protein Zmor_026919 [Zophobas morio]
MSGKRYVIRNLRIREFCSCVRGLLIDFLEVVGVNCTSRHINLSLVCIYRPPSSNIIDDQLLFDEIKSLSSLHSNLLIFGDFNFPKISWPNILISDNDGSEGLFKDMLLTTNLAQLVTFPTRFRIGHTPSLLDLILTSDQNLLSKIEQNPPIGVSDHCVIEASIQYFIPSVEKYCIKEFSKINFDNLKFDLASKNWDFLYATGSCGDAWDIFTTTISDAMAKNTVKTKIRFYRKKPWITQPFIRRTNVKKRLWARYKATGTQADYDQHRNFSNILKQDLKKAKQNYETKLVTSGPKAVFKYVRSKLSTKVSVPIVADKHNKLATSETETANLLADFFESVFTSEPVGLLHILGDICVIKSTGAEGVCTLFVNCEKAREDLRQYNRFPQVCGFQETQPIVCCRPRRIPGEISKAKCEEYSRYVYETSVPPIALFDAKPVTRNECGHQVTKLIVGGEATGRKEFPHMAAIGYDSYGEGIKWICGGTILSERYVLTAAHCLTDANAMSEVWDSWSWLFFHRDGDSNLSISTAAQHLSIERRNVPRYLGDNVTSYRSSLTSI